MFYRVIMWIALRRFDFIISADSPKAIPDILKHNNFFEKPDNIPFNFNEITELSAAQVDELLPYGTPITSFHDWETLLHEERRKRHNKRKQNCGGILE